MKVTVERHGNASDSRWVIAVRCSAISVPRTRLLEFKVANYMTIDFFQMVQKLFFSIDDETIRFCDFKLKPLSV